MATKKAPAKKTFSPEEKAEAVRLITQENHTLKQAASAVGCSVASLQNWKKAVDGKTTAKPATKAVKKAKKTKKKSKGKKKHTVATAVATFADKPHVAFDVFVQGYWSECAGAADVLSLPPDITPTAVEYVNNVLRYAYDQLNQE